MKLLEYKEFTFGHLIEKKNNGQFIELPWNVITSARSELTERIRGWLFELKCPYIMKSEDEAEELLGEIADSIDAKMNFPLSTSEQFFIQVTPNVIVMVSCADEYLGHGEAKIHTVIDGLIVEEPVTKEEIVNVVEWIKSFKR